MIEKRLLLMETPVALLAKLFRGDARVEVAAASDAAHVIPGSRGPHVGKIQTALNSLVGVGLDVDGVYGQKTANAALP
jgi:peptidoglycan hydrolase-like protein with peptidoglycan-binding domain